MLKCVYLIYIIALITLYPINCSYWNKLNFLNKITWFKYLPVKCVHYAIMYYIILDYEQRDESIDFIHILYVFLSVRGWLWTINSGKFGLVLWGWFLIANLI
jgi:hypothetical protein